MIARRKWNLVKPLKSHPKIGPKMAKLGKTQLPVYYLVLYNCFMLFLDNLNTIKSIAFDINWALVSLFSILLQASAS